MHKKAAFWLLVLLTVLLIAWGASAYHDQPGPDATQSGTTTSVPVSMQPDDSWQTATSDAFAFAVRYPQGWTLDSAYRREGVEQNGSGGYAFRVPTTLTSGTNLSEDSVMTVEVADGDGASCQTSWFLENAGEETRVTENGREWRVAKGGDAGAGNFYDETVYWAPIGDRCYGLRLFIHSTNIGNYDPGTVIEFDRSALDATFAQFRATFIPN